MNSAAQAFSEGRLEEAFILARDVLKSSPGHLDAMLLMGVIAARQHQTAVAIPLLMHVAELDSSSYIAFYWLSTALRHEGRLREAASMGEKAVLLSRHDPQALFQHGLCEKELENWVTAEASLQSAARLAPHVGPIQYNLGVVLQELGRSNEAARSLRRAVALNPAHVDSLYRLGQTLAHELDYQGAADHAELILTIDPDSIPGHSLLATALIGLNKPIEAVGHAARASALNPDRPDVLVHCGTTLQSAGRLEDARQLFRRAIEIEPRQGYAYYALVRSHKTQDADLPLVRLMEKAAGDPGLARRHRTYLEYALGKVRADLGDYELAMHRFDTANRMTHDRKLGQGQFQHDAYREGVDFVVQTFDERFIERFRDVGLQDALPIFVVGMMRSGTTLAEQILSSHPEIGAAGEQRFWSENRGVAIESPGNNLNTDRLRGLSREYLSLLQKIAPGSFRVVDKMPDNYAHLGLVHVALPNARFIHMRRNPIDTCLSIWSTPNSSPVLWSNDKKDIVFVYREYLRIMDHWRSILGADRLLEIDYEALVSDPEAVSRQMIEFCGLPWDDRCLRPEENPRAVATPSDWQVRQPIYRSAVERWRPYEPWLGEFLELLPGS